MGGQRGFILNGRDTRHGASECVLQYYAQQVAHSVQRDLRMCWLLALLARTRGRSCSAASCHARCGAVRMISAFNHSQLSQMHNQLQSHAQSTASTPCNHASSILYPIPSHTSARVALSSVFPPVNWVLPATATSSARSRGLCRSLSLALALLRLSGSPLLLSHQQRLQTSHISTQ